MPAFGGTTSAGGGASGGPAGGAPMTGGEAGAEATAGSGGAGAGGAIGSADPKFLVFLLLGQSNMVGNPQSQAEDRTIDPRIQVLAYDDCANVNRRYDEWYPASPPLHNCEAGVGPGDYFAKTLLEALPEGYTIGLVPCAVNGAPIDLFRKGVPRTGWTLPPDDHWETGYEWIVSRARRAQAAGVIRGILFHQGESNDEQPDWVDEVAALVSDLRADLALGEVPFLAGELYRGGCCPGHNQLVAALASTVSNGFVVSSEGLGGTDQYHFDLAGQRELGKRYGMVMQQALTLP